MNVLVIGSGGREHAIAYQISKNQKLNKLYVLPGNPGTSKIAENVEVKPTEHDKLIKFAKDNSIDLVIIGPEQPLVDGLADDLRQNGIKVFGPNKAAAVIEGDKTFAKELMNKYNIPTADFKIFEKTDYEKAVRYLDKVNYPVVVKASGLASGKGVLICNSKSEAESALRDCFVDSSFGEAGDKVVIEEYLEGEEASVFAITDGDSYVILLPSQDHKRIYDGDRGKNTGGMGAYAPAPIIDEELAEKIEQEIVLPTLEAMSQEGRNYNGCLYCGLMITKDGPKVIEYNCRFGDPETQVVLPILKGDLLELLNSTAEGKIATNAVSYNNTSAVCVVAASEGYPGKYKKGLEITGTEQDFGEDIMIFHAGTKNEDGKLVTSGGRVLNVVALSGNNNLAETKIKAYQAISKINFEGIFYRTDIADKGIKRQGGMR